MRQARLWTRVPESAQKAWIFQLASSREAQPIAAMEGVGNLYTRFAIYYEQLRRLPRRVRRALGKNTKVSLAGAALLLALGQQPALSATFTAGNAAELIAAINQANDEVSNPGPDTIELTDDIVLTAVDNTSYGPTGLPIISSAVTIEGNGQTIERDSVAAEFRILAVNSTGDLTLNETTVSGGVALPGGPLLFSEGGGILNRDGSVAMTASTVSSNSASLGGGVLNDDNGNLSVKESMISGNSGCVGGGVNNRGTAYLAHSTLSGNSACSGGGFYNQGMARVVNSMVADNFAFDGGGVVGGYDTLVMTNSTVSGNSATGYGGGVMTYDPSTLRLENCRVSGNSAGYDGGGALVGGTTAISNSTVSVNSADHNGGGVFIYLGYYGTTVDITNSTVSGNTAGNDGGGVFSWVTEKYELYHAAITGSTIASNTASNNGGGVFIYISSYGGTMDITNSTVSGNSANVSGGGVHKFDYYDLGAANITNTIVAVNTTGGSGENCGGDAVTSLGHNLADDETCSPNGTTDKTPVAFPGLTLGLGAFVADGPGRGHFPLLSESSAIDMGDPAVCPPKDQLGRTRNGVCDIGAVEFSSIIPEGALDADGNGRPDALTDGILFLRFLFGFTGDPLIAGVLGPDCTHCTPEEVEAFLENVPPDVDGNAVNDALTDGILILRFLFGFRGAPLIAGAVAPDCTRCTAEEIEAFLEPGLGP